MWGMFIGSRSVRQRSWRGVGQVEVKIADENGNEDGALQGPVALWLGEGV